MLVRRKSACKPLRAAAKFSDGLPHFWVQIWTPKRGPSKDLKEGMKMWSNSGPHFGVHIWTQKWGQPSENFAAARTCCASRFATLQLEHECQLIPFCLCGSQVRLLLYKKQSGTHREKKHVLTLTLMLVRRKSACKPLRAAAKFSDGWPHF